MNKRAKTHSSQWDRFLDFAEKNPVVLTKKIEGPFGKNKYDELWKELTTSLNSMGFVEKTTEKWQKVSILLILDAIFLTNPYIMFMIMIFTVIGSS